MSHAKIRSDGSEHSAQRVEHHGSHPVEQHASHPVEHHASHPVEHHASHSAHTSFDRERLFGDYHQISQHHPVKSS